MIHLKVQGSVIQGFETGTRALFDERHGGDSNWVFLDKDETADRIDIADFFKDPKSYYLDKHGSLQKIVITQPVVVGAFLTDSDGSPLTDGGPLTDRTIPIDPYLS